MLKRHRSLLTKNHEFLVNEVPMDETLDAINTKRILTSHDLDQLKTLRHQGRRAMVRYLLGVLPYRGPQAFDCFMESLQEANAQHVVDLLLQQNMNDSSDSPAVDEQGNPVTPSDTPLPPGPDPHEYAIRLSRNNKLIREFVQPHLVSPVLTQNKVMTAREADMVAHIHGKNKKWDLVMAVLLQRGERAYQAFMAALLQNGYNTIFHTIQETSTALSGSDTDPEDPKNTEVTSDDDEVIESDEEIKQEARESTKGNRSSVLQDLDLRQSNQDDPFLQTSEDLQDVNGNDDLSPTETDDRLSADTDLAGYLGYNDDTVSNGRNSAKSNTSKHNPLQKKKSNGSLALDSVKEETEDNPQANGTQHNTNKTH